MQLISNRVRFANALMWLLAAILFCNALAYVHAVSNPLITEDNWTFVDTFLAEAIHQRLDLGDFLVKRAGFDHGQPLNKVAMLIHYRWFGLDFTVEAMIGMMCAALGFVILYRTSVEDARLDQRTMSFQGAMAAIAAVYVSLNASYIYQFSLVTLGHLAQLLVFLTFYTAWLALHGRSPIIFALVMFAAAIAGDMSAVLTGSSLALVVIWYGTRLDRVREARRIVTIIVFALLAARLTYWGLGTVRGTTQAVFNVPMSEHFAGLMANLDEAWKWIIVPLTSGLICAKQLQVYFPQSWRTVQVAIGLLLCALHVWFWLTAVRAQPRAARFLALCLMLSFYAYLVGVLYGRVFVKGAGYLDQQRYVLFYQLNIMALLLMMAARQLEGRSRGWISRVAAPMAIATVLLLQVPLSLSSWTRAPGIVAHHRAAAAEYGRMARNPADPVRCGFSRRLCSLSAEERARIVRMLRDNRLSLHSPRFAKAHPELVQAAALSAR